MLTQERLKERLHYDHETGIFTRIGKHKNWRSGQIVDRKTSHGYQSIDIEYKRYYLHRLAWLFVYGVWPIGDVDHINHIKQDNRISNLREATRSENQMNRLLKKSSLSGIKGVSWDTGKNKWRAQLFIEGKGKHIGYFVIKADAEAAVKTLRELHHGVFANHG
jgi:hypothetical protein